MPLQLAAASQQLAAHPDHSAWVAASAGSGKTKVLTDRVLNLLLEGFAPERILCLTFTKAAAAEMANRVRTRLGEWAIYTQEELEKSLESLQGKLPSSEKLDRARSLFGLTLDTPGGLKIQTIHSFCQSLLKRFPLEAGLSPFFEVMNDTQAQALLKQAAYQVIAAPDHQDLALRFSEQTLEELNGFILQSRELFEDSEEILKQVQDDNGKSERNATNTVSFEHTHYYPDTNSGVCHPELVSGSANAHLLLQSLITPIPQKELREHLSLFEQGSPTDQARGQALATFLALSEEEKKEKYEDYLAFFLTQKGEKRACLLTQKAALHAPAFKEMLETEAVRLEEWLIAYHTLEIANISQTLFNYGQAFLNAYEALKKSHTLLDYEDLILKTAALLKNPGCHWVLYKLDGGLDHILVDEAQDTSPTQWQVIRSIAEEFYANATEDSRDRTLFIVGDGKQSIYSFQGADPVVFTQMQQDLSTFARHSGKTWKDIDLTVSFRSTPQILTVVDEVFPNCTHLPFRKESAGLVEIWPLIPQEKEDALSSWAPPLVQHHSDSPQKRLAQHIAQKIKGWLWDPGPLTKPITPGDILILVRRRTAFVDTLIRALKEHNVPVAGLDRLWLLESLAVQDLLKLGEFLLLPEDDLTLATVLKGPLCNLTEEDLFELVYPHQSRPREDIYSEKIDEAVLTTTEGRHHERSVVIQTQTAKQFSNFSVASQQAWIATSLVAPLDDDLRSFPTEHYPPFLNSRKESLWKKLQHNTKFSDTYIFLKDLLARVDFLTPFALFSFILGPLEGRQKWQARLGAECLDSLDEFLNLCLTFQDKNTPSLQGFLHWIGQETIELKRDLDQSNQVRIMTVHGSKGLQSPIVFLPDTTQIPGDLPPFTFHEGSLIWLPPTTKDIPLTKHLKQLLRAKQREEYNRLLYVALTRAEDALYVCGWEDNEEGSWYDMVKHALSNVGEEVDIHGFEAKGWHLTATQDHQMLSALPSAESTPFFLPGWLKSAPPSEEPLPLLRPSESGEEELFSSSEFGSFGTRRGILIHKLLETLASVPEDQRTRLALRYLEKENVPMNVAQDMAETVNRVFQSFPELFGPQSQGEVPIMGQMGNSLLSGQIDRLIVTDDHVLCVDFKTHTTVPAKLSDIPQTYMRQMALYRAALARIYPDRPILCGILWTHLPRFDLLTEDGLKKFIPSIDEMDVRPYTERNQA